MSLKSLNAAIKNLKFLENNLKNKKINQIYKNFDKSLYHLNKNENFIVAVSGGPDSLALAFLAKIYSIKRGIKSKFFIINHNLRAESSSEAKTVKKVLKHHFIESKIINWRGQKPKKNIQSLARNKRYELLFTECDKLNIKTVLLGHHQDDVTENFFIRLLRGSGLKGLISLDKKSIINDKLLLRPLINHKKEDLIFLSKKVFNFYVNDPSNKNNKYQRIRIRKLIKELQLDGLDKDKINNTIKNLRYSNKVVEFHVRQNLKENSFFLEKKKKLFLNKDFFEQSYEIVFRSLSESIRLIGGNHYSPRGKKLNNVIENINNNKFFSLTLGGCILKKVSQTVIISKER